MTVGYLDLNAACWTPLRKIVVLAVLSIVVIDVIQFNFTSHCHTLSVHIHTFPFDRSPSILTLKILVGRTEHPGQQEWPRRIASRRFVMPHSTWE